MRTWTTQLLQCLLPSVCPGCQSAAGPFLCANCFERCQVNDHSCERCANPRTHKHGPCPHCGDLGFPPLQSIHAPFLYQGALRRWLSNAKLSRNGALMWALSRCMSHALPSSPCEMVTVIPPRPGHQGPHLPTIIARYIAKELERPFVATLTMRRSPATQHHLTQGQRRQNVHQLYKSRRATPARVLLVDDLLTTGATLQSGARALRLSGSKSIHGICLARTPSKDFAS